jgi:hypothetical protein
VSWRARWGAWREQARGPWWLAVLALLTLAFATARLLVPHREPSWAGTYQALAHVFVGGLVGAWLADRKANVELVYLAVVLSAVELGAFLLAVFGGGS